MRRLLFGCALLGLCGCGVVDYFSGKVVARAGDQVLTTEWFAETMAEGNIPLQPTVLERWAWLWVQYSLYLQRLAAGDSLTDSLTVLDAMWPEVLTDKVTKLEESIVAEGLIIDSAVVDSAYAAGDHRIIDHILIRTGAALTASQIAQQRRTAERIQARLVSGRSWTRAVEESEDPETATVGGRVGMIERGQTVPQFEQAAYGLEPGEISEVIETQYGFHILRRPTLAEVRQEFTDQIEDLLAVRLIDRKRAEMTEQRRVVIREDAPEIVRDAAARPLRILALEPGRVIAEFEGGRLTDVGFAHWLQVMPRQALRAIDGASDEELVEIVRRIVDNELLKLEVVNRGIELSEERFLEIRNTFERWLSNLHGALRIDSAMAQAITEVDRKRVAREVLEAYVARTSENRRDMAIVPPLLAAKLSRESKWHFYYGGLNRAVRLAVELRAARDSTTS